MNWRNPRIKMSNRPDTDRVYTLEDLRDWDRSSPSFAVVGHPIAHSRSPLMHNAAFARLAEEGRPYETRGYFKFDVPPERLAEALELFKAARFVGLNLTIPHKVDAVPLVAGRTSQAESAGAVNTLVLGVEGYRGHNTDGLGFARACEARLGVAMSGAPVVLFGAGGAARAVAAAALEGGCSSLTIVNRDPERLRGLMEILLPLDKRSVGPRGLTPSELREPLPVGALVVNCTSLGLKPEDASPVPAGLLRADTSVYDTVYGAHDSALVLDARAVGAKVERGLSMLCWQGAFAFEWWTRGRAPVDAMWRAIGGVGPIE